MYMGENEGMFLSQQIRARKEGVASGFSIGPIWW